VNQILTPANNVGEPQNHSAEHIVYDPAYVKLCKRQQQSTVEKKSKWRLPVGSRWQRQTRKGDEVTFWNR
jgi:hypothetical protein